jgi:hypothetical protein
MAALGVEQCVAFVAPDGGNGGSAEPEAVDLPDDFFVAHEFIVTDRRARILDLDLCCGFLSHYVAAVAGRRSMGACTDSILRMR